MKSKTKKEKGWTNGVRLEAEVMELVRQHKEDTGIPIGRFINDLIRKKLEKAK